MYPKSCRGMLLAALCGLVAPAVAQAAPPLWKMLYTPLKRVEADPNKDYVVTETTGPWMIMAAAFSGDGAKDQARQLVLELREKYRLPAYLYQKKFDLGRRTDGRGTDRYGEPLKMRYARGDSMLEIAVMVGDYQSVDDPDAQKALKKIKSLEPAALDVNKRKTTSQTLANFRSLQKAVLPEGNEIRKKGADGGRVHRHQSAPAAGVFCPQGGR